MGWKFYLLSITEGYRKQGNYEIVQKLQSRVVSYVAVTQKSESEKYLLKKCFSMQKYKILQYF